MVFHEHGRRQIDTWKNNWLPHGGNNKVPIIQFNSTIYIIFGKTQESISRGPRSIAKPFVSVEWQTVLFSVQTVFCFASRVYHVFFKFHLYTVQSFVDGMSNRRACSTNLHMYIRFVACNWMDLKAEVHSSPFLDVICRCLDSLSLKIVQQVEGYVDQKLGVECHVPSCESVRPKNRRREKRYPSSIRLYHSKVAHPISRERQRDRWTEWDRKWERDRAGEGER
jgi:hypothetical protein